MKTIVLLFGLISLIFFSCNENQDQIKQKNKPGMSELSKHDNGKNFTIKKTPYLEKLNLVKTIVDQQNLNKTCRSVKFYDSDSITDFIYLRDLFPVWESDSIEFYGTQKRQELDPEKFPNNSLIIIYFNDKRLANNQIELLQYEWDEKGKNVETLLDRGGITFELANQLCVFTLNGSADKKDEIELLDSLLKSELIKHDDYNRVLTNNILEPFLRRVD